MLDVPRELVHYVSRLLAAERRARGTRRRTRAFTCWYQALMVLAWFRDDGDKTLPGAGFEAYPVPPPTATWQKASRSCPSRPLTCIPPCGQVADQGWSHVVVVGKLFTFRRLSRGHHPASKATPSTPGTREDTKPKTSKPSCAQTGYRSGPVMPYQGICTT